MMSQIEKLRQKSESTRKQIALLSTFVITGIIVMFWVYTLGERFSNSSSSITKEASSDKPLNILIGSVGNLSSDIRANVSDALNNTN